MKKNPYSGKSWEKVRAIIVISRHRDTGIGPKRYRFFLTLQDLSGGEGVLKQPIRFVRYFSLAIHM